MFRTQVFIFTFLMFFQVFPYPECMNEEKITEQCIKDVHKNGDLELVTEHIDKSVFKNRSTLIESIDAIDTEEECTCRICLEKCPPIWFC